MPDCTHDGEERKGQPLNGSTGTGPRLAIVPSAPSVTERIAEPFCARLDPASGVLEPPDELPAVDPEPTEEPDAELAEPAERAGAPAPIDKLPAVPDLYMEGLRERADRRERPTSSEPARAPRPVGAEPTVFYDHQAGAPGPSDELSDFFEQQAAAAPRPGGGQPLAQGSASLDPGLAPARRARVKRPVGGRATRRGAVPAKDRRSRSRRGARCLALGALGAALCAIVALASNGAGSGAGPARSASVSRATHTAAVLGNLPAILARASKAPVPSKAGARRTRRATPRAGARVHTPRASSSRAAVAIQPAAYHAPVALPAAPAYRSPTSPTPVYTPPVARPASPPAAPSRPPAYGTGGVLGIGHSPTS